METKRTGNRGAIAAALLLWSLAACSSTDASVEPESSVSSAAVPAVSEPTSSSSTTSVPSSTSEPAVESTVDPLDETTQDVEDAFAEQFVAWRACTADYDRCDPTEAFADVYGGRALTNLVEAVEDRQGVGRKNSPLQPDPDFQRVDELTFGDDDLTAAVIEYCSVDSRLVSVVNDEGEDEVFDSSVVHESGSALYELGPDDVWRLIQFDVVLRSSEEPLCDE